MKKYKYLGKVEVHVGMIGNVKAGQIVEAESINNPDFEEVKDEQKRQPEVVTK